MTRQAKRGRTPRAISSACEHGHRRLDHGPQASVRSGAPRRSMAATSERTSSAEFDLGDDDGVGPRRAGRREVVRRATAVPMPLTRIVSLTPAVVTGSRCRAGVLARRILRVRGRRHPRGRGSARRPGASWPSRGPARWSSAGRAPSAAGAVCRWARSLMRTWVRLRRRRRVARCGIQLGELGVGWRQPLGELEDDEALLEARVVLHLAVEHDRAGAVTHGLHDPAGVRDVLGATG